jgi:hypothetical protein
MILRLPSLFQANKIPLYRKYVPELMPTHRPNKFMALQKQTFRFYVKHGIYLNDHVGIEMLTVPFLSICTNRMICRHIKLGFRTV